MILMIADLQKWCQLPEPIAFEHAEMAACEDVGVGLSTLMDRYLNQCICQIVVPVVVPVYRAYHQTRVSEFKQKFEEKRIDVFSDHSQGTPCFINDQDEVMDPTQDQMLVFTERNMASQLKKLLQLRRMGTWALRCEVAKRARGWPISIVA